MTSTPNNSYEDALNDSNELLEELNELQLKHQGETEDQIAIEEENNRRKEIREKGSHAVLEPQEFGVKENLTELKNAVLGGARDTASSFITMPERFTDMANGEMYYKQQKYGSYEPEFNPLGGGLNPETKTWWGQLIRGGVHFGTMAIPIVGWGGAASKTVGVAGAVSRATIANPNFIVRGASVGAVQDLVAEYSQDANGLQVLRDRFGFVDTPITTNDDDHPALKTAKSMFEGLGIGTVADGMTRAIGKARARKGKTGNTNSEVLEQINTVETNRANKALKAANIQVDTNLRNATRVRLFKKGINFDTLTPAEQVNEMLKVQKADRSGKYSTWSDPSETNEVRAERKINEKHDDLKSQIQEKALQEDRDPNIRGIRDKEIVNPWQGNPSPTGKPYDVGQTLNRIRREWGAEEGSTDGLITSAATEQLAETGLGKKGITPKIAKELLGDARFKRVMENLNSKGRSLQEAYGDAYERFQEVVGGRDAATLEPDEFWGPISRYGSTQGDFEMWSVENILAADLVQESLFKQLRDRAMVAREVLAITDLNDIDGPTKYIRDNLIVGMEQVKRSKFLTSPEYQDIINTKGGKQQVEAILDQLHVDTKSQVDMMFDVARQSPSDGLLHAMVEAFSMSNNINNWKDFDGFMRNRLFGRTTEQGIKETGSLIRELQGVMVNSILSGPKTPLRAIMGTSTATFTRPMAQAIGGTMKYVTSGFTDASVLRQSLAEMNGMIHAIPESFELFTARLNGYWNGDISTIKSRFAEFSNSDEHWDLMRHWAEGSNATLGEKSAFHLANLAREANNNSYLSYSTKLMAATDDAFTLILARGRSRTKAMQAALDAQAHGLIPDIGPELIRDYQNRFYNEIFDPLTGTVKESWLSHARGEVTLTKDLSGFGKALDHLFSQQPALKPFYMFARTGINGLELTAKHTPLLNFAVKEFNDIAWAKPDNLSNVAKYGIETAEDLANAKALQNGRLALGSSIMFMAYQKYLNGEITGNGPTDPQLRRVWQSTGWIPRSIKLGGVWVSHESIEPFTSLLSMVADYGDNQRLMGDEWVEKGILSHSFIIGKALYSKTYLQGMTTLTDLFGRNPRKLEKIAANISNNMIPMAGLRNEIGKVINPYMKELNSGFWENIRNRNQTLEMLLGENPLPIKYDILTGQPINDWDPLTRMFNAISPIHLNFDQSPGRKFLFRSNFDIGLSTYTAPDGTDLSNNPELRSEFQKLIGKQDLENKLAKLAERADVQESIAQMEEDITSGRTNRPPGISAMSYLHNQLIYDLIHQAKRSAWAEMQSNPAVTLLQGARDLERAAAYKRKRGRSRRRSTSQYDQATQLLEMTNK